MRNKLLSVVALSMAPAGQKMPEIMKQAMLDAKSAPNQIVYWSRPVNWRDQTLTPNPGTIYFNPFYDVTNGLVVL